MNAPDCACYRCDMERKEANGLPLISTRMHLCDQCGNKRCPHATDHRHDCTNSNEPGQQGSNYA